MKICFVANADSIHTRRWVSFFVKKGHDVTVVTHSRQKIEGAKMVRIWTLMEKEITNPFLLRILKIFFGDMRTSKFLTFGLNFFLGVLHAPGLIRKINPDVVHAHFVSNHGYYAALSKVHPFVLTPWGTDVLIVPTKSKFFHKVTRFTLKAADVLTSDGDNTIDAIVKLGVDPAKTRKIYFGIDTKNFTPEKRSQEHRTRMGASKDTVFVISLRGLDPIYNLQLLIKSIPAVVKECPYVHYILVGRGSQEDHLKSLAKELGVEKNVTFIRFLEDADFPVYPANADIYVSTSLSESGLASATSESMASGLPVLLTDAGSSRDWVTDDVNGYIIPNDDPEYLASKIIKLAKDGALRKKFGDMNRKLVLEKQDYYGEMSKVEKIYMDLIAEKKTN